MRTILINIKISRGLFFRQIKTAFEVRSNLQSRIFRFPVFIGYLPKIIGFSPENIEIYRLKIRNRKKSAVTSNLKKYIMAQNFRQIECTRTIFFYVTYLKKIRAKYQRYVSIEFYSLELKNFVKWE